MYNKKIREDDKKNGKVEHGYVETDPTGRYGRVSSNSRFLLSLLSLWLSFIRFWIMLMLYLYEEIERFSGVS